MTVAFENLKNSLSERVYPVYLIEGEDGFFRDRASAIIKGATLKEPALNYTRMEGSDIKTSQEKLLMDLGAFPFMSDYRVIEVFDWQPTAAELKGGFKEYFENPNETSVLIVVNTGRAEALKKFDCVCVVDCRKADISLITRYIRSKASKSNLIISNSTCKMIADFTLFDMARIDSETDKLIDYCRGGAEIDDKAVETIVAKETDYKIYEIVGFIARKNYSKVYEIIKDVVTPSDKQQIFVSLYYHFRRMFYAKVNAESSQTLAQNLGEKEYTMRMAKEQAEAFSPKRLKQIVENLAALDRDYKSGNFTLEGAYDMAIFGVLTGENK